AAGYATRRDLSGLARVAFWALLALIVFGIVLIFVNIPNGAVIYAVLGLVIFAAFTLVDFQRLRRTKDIRAAPLLAASIFLDVLSLPSRGVWRAGWGRRARPRRITSSVNSVVVAWPPRSAVFTPAATAASVDSRIALPAARPAASDTCERSEAAARIIAIGF